ncbi:hypothetical protein O0L34_g1540 [Tuta absoluta]|nr:hypothetical protein O0L34_g1540 [Tuta absoluta]
MASYVLNTCCDCIGLRTGCLIISYLSLIGEIFFIIVALVGLHNTGVLATEGKTEVEKLAGEAGMIWFISLLVGVLVYFIFTVILLVGIYTNKSRHVKAYLIFNTITLVVSIINMFKIVASLGETDSFQETSNRIALGISITINSKYLA